MRANASAAAPKPGIDLSSVKRSRTKSSDSGR